MYESWEQRDCICEGSVEELSGWGRYIGNCEGEAEQYPRLFENSRTTLFLF